MAAAVDKADRGDITIVRDNRSVIDVKSVTLDDTKTKLDIETYVSMVDGATYTVTYTAQDEAETKSSKDFVATNGVIARFAISTETVPVNKATTIKYSALDANGIVIYENPITKMGDKIEIDKSNISGGYWDADKLTLYAVGDSATVTISHHTYVYEAGVEKDKIEHTFTIKAVEDTAVASKYAYTIVKGAATVPAWEKVTAKTQVALKDDDRFARFQIKDSNGADITATCGYTVESSDASILIANGEVKDGVWLNPVKIGSAYLILKDKDGKSVQSMPISVVKERFLATLTLDKNTVSIATTAAAGAPGAVAVGFSAKDQYGDAFAVSGISTPTIPNATGTITSDITLNAEKTGGTIALATTGVDAKNYVVTLTATDSQNSANTRQASFTLKVVKPNNVTSAAIQVTKGSGTTSGEAIISTLDTTVTDKTTDRSVISLSLVQKSNGVVIDSLSGVSIAAIKITDNAGKVVAATGGATTEGRLIGLSQKTQNTTGSAVTDVSTLLSGKLNITAVDQNGSIYTKNLTAGTYTVQAVLAGKTQSKDVLKATFKVEDKQPSLTANVLKTVAGATTSIESVLTDETFVKFVYDGVTQVDENGKSTIVNGGTIYGSVSGKTAYVNSAIVGVKVGDNTVMMKVAINRTFTNDYGWAETLVKP